MNIESKLYELECKCVEKLGEDKCYKVAFGVMIVLFNTPTLLFVLSFYFFPIAAFKFAIIIAISMFFAIVTLLVRDFIFYVKRFFKGY